MLISNQSAFHANFTEKRKANFKLKTATEGFYQKPENSSKGFGTDRKMEVSAEEPKPARKRTTSPKARLVDTNPASSVLMARHFLKEELMVIFEDVLTFNKKNYHCFVIKPQDEEVVDFRITNLDGRLDGDRKSVV